jgi:putative flippase GtrA
MIPENPSMTVQPQPGVELSARPRDFGRIIRYLLVGGWNTAFGYGVFAVLNYLLTGTIPYAYMVANLLANVISITIAYFGYKFFVFKTKGNYLREYLRTYLVYGATCLASLAMLPVAVVLVRLVIANRVLVPYIAQAIILPIVVASSYFGHKKFSFRAR